MCVRDMFCSNKQHYNNLLSSTNNQKCVTPLPDGYHLAFLNLKISKVTDKKRLGKAASLKQQLPNWPTNCSAFLLASWSDPWEQSPHDIRAHYKFPCQETFPHLPLNESHRACLYSTMFLPPPTSCIHKHTVNNVQQKTSMELLQIQQCKWVFGCDSHD
jgi:hypothetical protein